MKKIKDLNELKQLEIRELACAYYGTQAMKVSKQCIIQCLNRDNLTQQAIKFWNEACDWHE